MPEKTSTSRRLMLSTHLSNFSAEAPEDWTHLIDRARAADRAGIDRLVVSDHVVFGERLDAYGRPEIGGIAGGRQPTGPDGHWLEPLTLLSVVAGLTDRVRLSTGILIAALRRPVVLAKVLATLDVLSKGRVDLGVGVGWQREEYQAAGLVFEERGELLDQSLAVMRELWTRRRASFIGRDLEFENIHAMPKPLQPGGVPIWVAGTANPRAATRLATFGSGWIPWGPAAKDPTEGIAQMRNLVEDLGGSFAHLDVVGTLAVERSAAGAMDLKGAMEAVPHLASLGVTDVRVSVPVPRDPAAAFDTYSELVEAFRAAIGGSHRSR